MCEVASDSKDAALMGRLEEKVEDRWGVGVADLEDGVRGRGCKGDRVEEVVILPNFGRMSPNYCTVISKVFRELRKNLMRAKKMGGL